MSPRYMVNLEITGHSYFYIEAETAGDARAEAEDAMDLKAMWSGDFEAEHIEISTIEEDS
jgi:hypothetical protein